MKFQSALIHISAAISIGALLAAFTAARWMAASFWVSSALILNGVVSTVEDARPGGFENADGSSPPPNSNTLALKAAVFAITLAGLGFAVQFLWLPS